MRSITVMITGCSKHSKEIVDCLKKNEDEREVKVVAVNMDRNKLLRHGTDYQYVAPPITDPGYIPFLKKVCRETNTDVIIPYITAELELMARYKREFSEMGVQVSVSDYYSVSRLNDKNFIGSHYSDWTPKQIEISGKQAPTLAALTVIAFGSRGKQTCCKIVGKCGGTGFCIVDDEKAYDISTFNRCGVNRYISNDDLRRITERGHPVILQEYIPGLDYSVCVLADHGKPYKMVGYVGYDMEFGAVVNGQIVTNHEAFDIVEHIIQDMHFDGNACFDFILEGTDRESSLSDLRKAPVKLLECNPRINASIGFCWHAGANLVYLRCKQLLKEDLIGTAPKIQEGLRMQKYYESEYFV